MQHALDVDHLPELWPALSKLERFGAAAPVEPAPAPVDWYAAIDAWARERGYAGPAAPVGDRI
jgi:hypothetical protein